MVGKDPRRSVVVAARELRCQALLKLYVTELDPRSSIVDTVPFWVTWYWCQSSVTSVLTKVSKRLVGTLAESVECGPSLPLAGSDLVLNLFLTHSRGRPPRTPLRRERSRSQSVSHSFAGETPADPPRRERCRSRSLFLADSRGRPPRTPLRRERSLAGKGAHSQLG